jgi:hypothetical protein
LLRACTVRLRIRS